MFLTLSSARQAAVLPEPSRRLHSRRSSRTFTDLDSQTHSDPYYTSVYPDGFGQKAATYDPGFPPSIPTILDFTHIYLVFIEVGSITSMEEMTITCVARHVNLRI